MTTVYKHTMWLAPFIALALTLWNISAPAAEMSGPVRVIDGDTLEMDGVRIRLWGIDAPEMQQTCDGKDGSTYECGRDSAAVMRELTRGRTVACDPRGHDQYGRIVAVCRTEAGDVSAAIVRRGWAVDWPRYSHARYHGEEQAARDQHLGILVRPLRASLALARGASSLRSSRQRLPTSGHQRRPVFGPRRRATTPAPRSGGGTPLP